MTDEKKTALKGRKRWNDGLRDIGDVGPDRETVSEGISRLNTAIRKDKRDLRRKK